MYDIIDPEDLLNTAPCGFLIFSDAGIILSVNDTLLKLLGYQKEQLLQKSIESILTLANRIFYQTHLFPLIKLQGKADEIFLTLLSVQREEVHVLLNAVRKTHQGILTNHCILVPVQQRRKYENELLLAKKAAEDALLKNEVLLNAQRKLEEHKREMDRQVTRLTQMHRELSQFGKVISHDIQEPIRKIAIFADIALQQAENQKNDSLISALEKIKSSCFRMGKLVSSLEQFITLEAAENKLQQVDLNKVVEKAKAMAEASTNYKDAVEIDQENLPLIVADRKQMEVLFFNLIENAIRFRKPDGEVQIKISSTIFQENRYKSFEENYNYQDVVKIVFTDNGKGFDTTYGTNLFQLFQKLQIDSYGTGLGLALCKKILDNHFGEISVDSEPGTGTSFYIIIPLLNQASLPY